MAPSIGIGESTRDGAALRGIAGYPVAGGSIFEDPGDEKSWHRSQRSEELSRFYEDREPSWYASAIAPLKGAERVLDLGCGPGLALGALREQGSSSVWGVDRWPAFAAGADLAGPVIAHDLTLPMPFLGSGSFDGVFSHYVLDYMSPVGVRQVLREACRLLAPGGLLAIYLAAVGLGGRDESRTVAYAPGPVRLLLEEAGLEAVEVSAPNAGRNTAAIARRPQRDAGLGDAGGREAWAAIEGETQLSASFAGGETLECELAAPGRGMRLGIDLPRVESAESRVSVCARVQRAGSGGRELQLWAWRGRSPVAAERVGVGFSPRELRLACAGSLEHSSVWSPGEVSLEPPGNAYARLGDLPDAAGLGEVERAAEGRQIVVQGPGEAPAELAGCIGAGRNRFAIGRGPELDLDLLDREWLSGRLHGVALDAEALEGSRARTLLLWAAWRQALVFLEGPDWQSVVGAASARRGELGGPVVLVDPALGGGAPAEPLPAEALRFVEADPRPLLVLSAGSRNATDPGDRERFSRRLLHGGGEVGEPLDLREATEGLRRLTERTLLMRLRQAYGRSPAEVGRRADAA